MRESAIRTQQERLPPSTIGATTSRISILTVHECGFRVGVAVIAAGSRAPASYVRYLALTSPRKPALLGSSSGSHWREPPCSEARLLPSAVWRAYWRFCLQTGQGTRWSVLHVSYWAVRFGVSLWTARRQRDRTNTHHASKHTHRSTQGGTRSGVGTRIEGTPSQREIIPWNKRLEPNNHSSFLRGTLQCVARYAPQL